MLPIGHMSRPELALTAPDRVTAGTAAADVETAAAAQAVGPVAALKHVATAPSLQQVRPTAAEQAVASGAGEHPSAAVPAPT
jgi:hypothetical protein